MPPRHLHWHSFRIAAGSDCALNPGLMRLLMMHWQPHPLPLLLLSPPLLHLPCLSPSPEPRLLFTRLTPLPSPLFTLLPLPPLWRGLPCPFYVLHLSLSPLCLLRYAGVPPPRPMKAGQVSHDVPHCQVVIIAQFDRRGAAGEPVAWSVAWQVPVMVDAW